MAVCGGTSLLIVGSSVSARFAQSWMAISLLPTDERSTKTESYAIWSCLPSEFSRFWNRFTDHRRDFRTISDDSYHCGSVIPDTETCARVAIYTILVFAVRLISILWGLSFQALQTKGFLLMNSICHCAGFGINWYWVSSSLTFLHHSAFQG